MTDNQRARIQSTPGKCGGRPCIGETRIRVMDVLGWLAAGMSREEILADYDELQDEDITAALAYAAGLTDHASLTGTAA